MSSRLAVNLAQTIFDLGGTAVNYMPVATLLKENGLIAGAVVQDLESGKEHNVQAKVVVNATGVFTDSVRKMDEPETKSIVTASQGSHVVLPKAFLPGTSAIMVPHTPDGRVLFAVPWHDHVVVGTTDVAVNTIQREPTPMDEEIAFILTNAAKYLSKAPTRKDVLSVFAGLRPLVRVGDAKSTAALSRDHTILISNSGLLTIAGGKWTTFRKMAEDAVDQAQSVAGLDERPCATTHLRIHGSTKQKIESPFLSVYGTDAPAVQELATLDPALAEKIHPDLPYIKAEVFWAVREEMARTVEDVLSRRTRGLLLGARASIEAAPVVADLLARELGRDEAWENKAVADYKAVAQGYVLND